MNTPQIRSQFIEFFTQRDHKHLPEAPLVNHDDAKLFFVNAGMNPFINILLGQQPAPHPRVVNSQPCLRVTGKHNDLEEVGFDTYHHTLFEMLGNWSFGDYTKDQAIQWAWELLTTIYQIHQNRLYATVFGGEQSQGLAPDQESYQLWQKYLPKTHILYGNQADNFWSMGPTGPCGPCTEIHVDLRSTKEMSQTPGEALVNQGHRQVIELWNLVFITYNRLSTGALNHLPKQHVDTGMGLERLAMVLQNKKSTYDTDAFAPLVQAIAQASRLEYGVRTDTDTAIRVIADHMRAITLAIAHGQPPTNQKGGYVVRRILRRAIRYGYTHLGFKTPHLYNFVPLVAKQLSHLTEIHTQQQAIANTIQQEEATFLLTLGQGLKRLTSLRHTLPGQVKVIDGATIFKLYDTYGFPPDLTGLIAREQGLQIDYKGFEQAMKIQKNRSKAAENTPPSDWYDVQKRATMSQFVGYDQLEIKAHLIQYRTQTIQGVLYYQLVLDRTPFYAEGGGQVGDTGHLVCDQNQITVQDTKKVDGCIIHYTTQLPHPLKAPLHAQVDADRRQRITNNHTATHLLQAALTSVLGKYVLQKGSLINQQLLRFDFTCNQKLEHNSLKKIEQHVNQNIRANLPLQEKREVPLDEAKKMGAKALFSEKYGEKVRVVTFGNLAQELCGGTHVSATGQIGFFKIVKSASAGAGIRRIEAMTAQAAEGWVHQQTTLLDTISQHLSRPKDPSQALASLLDTQDNLKKSLKVYASAYLELVQSKLASHITTVQGIHTLIAPVHLPDVPLFKRLAKSLSRTLGSHFLVLTTVIKQQAYVAVVISKDLCTHFNAHDIMQTLVKDIQGSGGGTSTFAMGRGEQPTGIDRLKQAAHHILKRHTAKNFKSS